MNKYILNTDIQEFILKNLNTDISSLLLKKPIFQLVDNKELAIQILSKKKCLLKLPEWFKNTNIYYPETIAIEQASSEYTAKYKSNLVSGSSIFDLCGGFGIDSFYFSRKVLHVVHCELQKGLSEIVTHNFKALKRDNIETLNDDGIDFIKRTTQHFDWIYIDPSRRNLKNKKVFMLKDCTPNVVDNLDTLFKISDNILIKTSPLLDISLGLKELKAVREVHVIAVKNEVKELLWVLQKNFTQPANIKTVNLQSEKEISYDFHQKDEKNFIPEFSNPLQYLYEPNAAILKAGAFNSIAKKYQLKKLHPNSHLYTGNRPVDFPGRHFKILEVKKFHKKTLRSQLKNQLVNISTRNFPQTALQLKKELKTKDGGDSYYFFTSGPDNKKIVIISKRC